MRALALEARHLPRIWPGFGMLLLDIDDGTQDSLLKNIVKYISLHDTVHFIRSCTNGKRVGEIDFLQRVDVCNSNIVQLLKDLYISDTRKGKLDTHLNLTMKSAGSVSRIEVLATFMKMDNFIKSMTINQSILRSYESDRAFAAALAANYTLTKLNIFDSTIDNIAFVEMRRNLLVELNATNTTINDSQADLLCTYVSESKCLKSLGLCYCGIDEMSASKLARALVSNTNNGGALTSLDLADNKVSDEGAIAIARALPFTSLSKLDLRDNSISDPGMSSLFTAIIGSNTLTSLTLRSNFCSESISKLATVLKCKTSITDLDLRCSIRSDQSDQSSQCQYRIAEALLANPIKTFSGIRIEELRSCSDDTFRYGGSEIGIIELILICKILIETKKVKYLTLEDNCLDVTCGKVLADFISCTNVETLSLSDNDICGGVLNISKALCSNSTLTSLTMISCGIGDDEATTLAEALRLNTCLKSLDVSHNEIGRIGEKALGKALSLNICLIEFCIGNNRLEYISNIADALRRNTTLETLDIRCNGISDNGAIMLSRAIKSNSSHSLKYLIVSGNPHISLRCKDNIKEALAMTGSTGSKFFC